MNERSHLEVQAAMDAITARRGWPWQTPGRTSVGLDEQQQIVEYVTDENGEPVPLRVLGRLRDTEG